jgi:argininosuccinate synthase
MLLKDALLNWIARLVSGSVTLELRRGNDYTIMKTEGEHFAYSPEKLSMEKTSSMFTPADRIGSLHLQDLSVTDNRNLLKRLHDLPAEHQIDWLKRLIE